MTVGTIHANSVTAQKVQFSVPQASGKAADGDSKAVEAVESITTKQTEKSNGGFAPTSSSPTSAAKTLIDKLV